MGQGGGGGALLAAIGACADGGRLESVFPSVGSDKPCVPEEGDKSTIVSRPTYVLNPIVLSKLSDDTMGSGGLEMLLDDILTQTNYCVSWPVFLAHLLNFLFIQRLSISSTSSSTCLARCFLHCLTAHTTPCPTR